MTTCGPSASAGSRSVMTGSTMGTSPLLVTVSVYGKSAPGETSLPAALLPTLLTVTALVACW